MSFAVDLPSEMEPRLRAAAAEHGQTIGDYLRAVLDKLLPPASRLDAKVETRVLTGAGKFAHVPFSSDDLCRERHEQGLRELERDPRERRQRPACRDQRKA